VKKKTIIDIECEQRGIVGELSFDSDKYDELEIMDIGETIMKVVEAWCRRREFVHENIEEYDIVFN
jgi:hypothetical protein